jgi:SynChlorMet cassette protein ScmC
VFSLKLDLADGQQWLIRPVDDKAAAILAELGKAMRLSPGEAGRELWIAVHSEGADTVSAVRRAGAVVCCLADTKQTAQGSATDRNVRAVQVRRVASVIASEALVRGGLLLHGALAEFRGSGFVMAAPGGVGKSTASRRLPSPWRSLCDDMTLVVRDATGRSWAHPWPTWRLFLDNGPGGSWAVEHAVPLRAIFFLGRAPVDRLELVSAAEAAALTLESALDFACEASRLTDVSAARKFWRQGVSAARALASAVPAYSLKLGLDGRFWEEIERVLPVGAAQGSGEDSRVQAPVSVEPIAPDDSLRMVYAGTSMYPTFQEPDLLEVKSYGTRRVRRGDVVSFKLPETATTVVHRVVAAGPDGIRTRRDNGAKDDPWVLQAGDITGRVRAVQRGSRRRVALGGWQGLVVLRCTRLGRGIQRCAGILPHTLYDFVAGLGPFDRLLPASLRPRLVRFDVRRQVFLKLLMGKQMVGHYSDRFEEWRIRRPFRLFVNEQSLSDPRS